MAVPLREERGELQHGRANVAVSGLSGMHLLCAGPGDSRMGDTVSDHLVVGMPPNRWVNNNAISAVLGISAKGCGA